MWNVTETIKKYWLAVEDAFKLMVLQPPTFIKLCGFDHFFHDLAALVGCRVSGPDELASVCAWTRTIA